VSASVPQIPPHRSVQRDMATFNELRLPNAGSAPSLP